MSSVVPIVIAPVTINVQKNVFCRENVRSTTLGDLVTKRSLFVERSLKVDLFTQRVQRDLFRRASTSTACRIPYSSYRYCTSWPEKVLRHQRLEFRLDMSDARAQGVVSDPFGPSTTQSHGQAMFDFIPIHVSFRAECQVVVLEIAPTDHVEAWR